MKRYFKTHSTISLVLYTRTASIKCYTFVFLISVRIFSYIELIQTFTFSHFIKVDFVTDEGILIWFIYMLICHPLLI